VLEQQEGVSDTGVFDQVDERVLQTERCRVVNPSKENDIDDAERHKFIVRCAEQ